MYEIQYQAIVMVTVMLTDFLVSVYGSYRHPSVRTSCEISWDNRVADCKGLRLGHVPTALPPSLEELDLSYNALQVISEGDFANLGNLRVLKLQYNNISMIEDEAFQNNILLEELNIFNNSLGSIPAKALEPLAMLRSLEMSNNFYTEATLPHAFSTFTQLKILSLGGPLIKRLNKKDFWTLRNISLEKFAIKSASSLLHYDPGCLKVITTRNMWFDVALDQTPDALPMMLQDLANKTFSVLRFRNLFEFKYYSGADDILQGFKHISMHHLIFHRGKFNENLLRMALVNLQNSSVKLLGLLSIDFARSATFLDSGLDSSVNNLILDDLILRDISNPDILRFDWRFTWFSKVRRLYINNVNFNFVPCDAWDEMKMVEQLDVSNNRLQNEYIYNQRCSYSGTVPLLKSFNISVNQLTRLKDVVALVGEFKNMGVIDLSYNQLGSTEVMGECTWKQNLTKVILHHNNFINSDLSCLPKNVQYLDLSYCNIDYLDMEYFDKVSNLKELLLSGNKIKFIPSGWSSPTLRSLTLDGNSFGLMSMGSFKDMPNLSRLKAGNNPYHCTCDLHTFFQETTAKGTVNVTDWPENYRCYHPESFLNMVVAKYFPGYVACDIRLVVIISVASTAAVVLVVMLLCYLFNVPWYMKATYQIIRAKYRAYQEGSKLPQAFDYHAFISYSHSDADWVRDQLLTYLESSTPPYRVCIHERDFLPGKWIIDNIIDNIENSRKVRTYCKLKKMLNTKTYLEWPKEAKQQTFFWAQLKSVLGKPTISGDQDSSTRRRSLAAAVSTVELSMEERLHPEYSANV
ncbi:toll-like receptor 2 [Arapaima gigas]